MTQEIRNTEAPLIKGVFFRSHVVELNPKDPVVSTYNEPVWPEYALVFDTETTLDPQRQSLLFGFYRVCQLQGTTYLCIEEGVLHTDELEPKYLEIIGQYVRTSRSEVVGAEHDERIHVYSRADFVEHVFF